MKSIQWTFRALVILIAVTSTACGNRGGGKSGSGRGVRQTDMSQRANRNHLDNGTGRPMNAQQAAARRAQELEQARIEENRQGVQQQTQAQAAVPVQIAPAGASGTIPGKPVTGVSQGSATTTVPVSAEAAAMAKLAASIPNNSVSTSVGSSAIVGSSASVSTGGSWGRTEELVFARSNDNGSVSDRNYNGSGSTFIQRSEVSRGRTEDLVITSGAANNGVGPGWPAGYESSVKTPAITGLIDQNGKAFTDSKDDEVMAVIVSKMNAVPPQVREDSQKIASAISQINLAVDRSVISLDLVFTFTDRETVETFSGYLTGNNRTALLTQRQSSSGEQYQVQVTCVDADTNCRVAVLTIDQMKAGQICHRIFAVHRWMMDGVGDGHFTLSKRDFEKSTQIYAEDKKAQEAMRMKKPITQDLIVKNPAERAFLRVVGNTIFHNRKMNGEPTASPDSLKTRSPKLGFLGIRSWAVAYGPSYIEIDMGKAKAGAGGVLSDSTRFSGLLTKPRVAGELAEILAVQGSYSAPEVNQRYDERFSTNINAAALIDNDGRGAMTLNVMFKGGGATLVNFTGLRIPTLRGEDMLRVLPQ